MPAVAKRAEAAASRARLKARAFLHDLYGDFAMEDQRPGAMRLSAVVQLAGLLGVSEMAVRSAAARMVQDGWFSAERHKRESVYTLTQRGRQSLQEGRERTFRPPDAWWNGSWCVVALSVPESSRELRDRMRKTLSWLGFGSPSSALYVSARDSREEVLRAADELGATGYLQVYRAEALWPREPRDLVGRAWSNLDAVNRRYGEFVAQFRPQLARTRARFESKSLSDRDAFKLRIDLTAAFRRCLFDDPNLPLDLLPARWNGLAARLLFREFHALVSPAALRYVDAVSAGTVEEQPEARRRVRRATTAA
jgi:phenylacetic acid degradation operon negative regulatory protein